MVRIFKDAAQLLVCLLTTLVIALVLVGCREEAPAPVSEDWVMDTSTDTRIRESASDISALMSASQKLEFAEALLYFQMQGQAGLSQVEGLTGPKVIEAHKQALANVKE